MMTLHLMPARANPASRLLVNSVLPTPGKAGHVHRDARLKADRDELHEVFECHGSGGNAGSKPTRLDTEQNHSD